MADKIQEQQDKIKVKICREYDKHTLKSEFSWKAVDRAAYEYFEILSPHQYSIADEDMIHR